MKAAFLMHEAWNTGLVFLGSTIEQARAKAEAHVEAVFREAWDGEGAIEEWYAECWEQDGYIIEEAEVAE